MRLTAHQPQYLPYLGHIAKIADADMFCLFDAAQMTKKDFVTRNRIKTANGVIWLSVPCENKGHFGKRICDTEVNNGVDWRNKHAKSIEMAYKKAPYFNEYWPFFEDLYSRPWEFICDLDEYTLKWLLDTLGVKVKFVKASDYDFRGYKSDLVLDMCKTLGATEYVFGALGRDYCDEDSFKAAGIKIEFQDYVHPIYTQLHGDFTPYCSVLDLLMMEGQNSLAIIKGVSMDDKDTVLKPQPVTGTGNSGG